MARHNGWGITRFSGTILLLIGVAQIGALVAGGQASGITLMFFGAVMFLVGKRRS